MGLADRLDQLVDIAPLLEIAQNTAFQHLGNEPLVGVHGEGQNLDGGILGEDLPGRLDAVELGEADIHDHQVGLELEHLAHRGAAVARFSDDLELRMLLQKRAEPVQQHLMIVHEEDFNCH